MLKKLLLLVFRLKIFLGENGIQFYDLNNIQVIKHQFSFNSIFSNHVIEMPPSKVIGFIRTKMAVKKCCLPQIKYYIENENREEIANIMEMVACCAVPDSSDICCSLYICFWPLHCLFDSVFCLPDCFKNVLKLEVAHESEIKVIKKRS